MTIDHVRTFYDNNIPNATKMNSKVKMSKLCDHDGFPIYHAEASLPWPMSNRSTISCTYRSEADGVFTVVASSRGNEAQVAEFAKVIGKNVVAILHVQFARYTPYEGGMDIVTVVCSDPAGSIPDGMKTK